MSITIDQASNAKVATVRYYVGISTSTTVVDPVDIRQCQGDHGTIERTFFTDRKGHLQVKQRKNDMLRLVIRRARDRGGATRLGSSARDSKM